MFFKVAIQIKDILSAKDSNNHYKLKTIYRFIKERICRDILVVSI